MNEHLSLLIYYQSKGGNHQLRKKRPHKDKYVKEQAVAEKINIRKGEKGFCQIDLFDVQIMNVFKT